MPSGRPRCAAGRARSSHSTARGPHSPSWRSTPRSQPRPSPRWAACVRAQATLRPRRRTRVVEFQPERAGLSARGHVTEPIQLTNLQTGEPVSRVSRRMPRYSKGSERTLVRHASGCELSGRDRLSTGLFATSAVCAHLFAPGLLPPTRWRRRATCPSSPPARPPLLRCSSSPIGGGRTSFVSRATLPTTSR